MEKTYDICIIGGCGHVGLPLGLAFATRGQKVVLCDINQQSVDKVNHKIVPFMDEGAPEALAQTIDSGHLKATTEKSSITASKTVILVTGTPVDEHLNPKLNDVIAVVKGIIDHLTPDQLIILRSTIYPGVTRKVYEFLKGRMGQASVAFCPERVAEGHGLKEITQLPQIVSACDADALKKAKAVFSVLGAETVELEPEEAELAKLFTNTWRYINFATANQFYMLAQSAGLDFYRIYNAMTFHYPRLQGFAKAGFAAGPCLFKDTMQLSAFSGNQFFLGHAAMLLNEGLPSFVVEGLKHKVDLSKKTVGILGMAFKANNDDPRESLAYKLKKILEIEAHQVLCSDVYIKEPEFVEAAQLVEKSDIIILAAPHREYKTLDLKGKMAVDVWNFWERK